MVNSFLAVPKYRWIFAGCWLGWIGLQALLLYGQNFSLEVSLADSFSSNVLLAVACWLLSDNLRYYRPEQSRYLYLAVWCFLLSGIWIGIVSQGLLFLLPSEPGYPEFFGASLPVRFCFGLLIIGWMALISVLWYNQLDQQEQEQRQAEAEKLAREAELYNLRQQLKPHFLFNSLNSINALIGRQPQEARKMTQQLSDFLRNTLKREGQQWATLEEELLDLKLYLAIEQVRFQHRLQTEINCDEACLPMKIPPMLLQPIVENAIKFGLYDTTDAVTISLNIFAEPGNLVITVSNPFDPATAKPRQGTGFGLNGVKRRLYLLFSRQDLLQTSIADHIFTTTIKIPQA